MSQHQICPPHTSVPLTLLHYTRKSQGAPYKPYVVFTRLPTVASNRHYEYPCSTWQSVMSSTTLSSRPGSGSIAAMGLMSSGLAVPVNLSSQLLSPPSSWLLLSCDSSNLTAAAARFSWDCASAIATRSSRVTARPESPMSFAHAVAWDRSNMFAGARSCVPRRENLRAE